MALWQLRLASHNMKLVHMRLLLEYPVFCSVGAGLPEVVAGVAADAVVLSCGCRVCWLLV